MNAEQIKQIVKETVSELKRQGMLQNDINVKYKEASDILKQYYLAEETEPGFMPQVGEALCALTKDPYYSIIPLYYCHLYTIERIAELLEVEVSTVTRNKKRLCIAFYDEYTNIANGNHL